MPGDITAGQRVTLSMIAIANDMFSVILTDTIDGLVPVEHVYNEYFASLVSGSSSILTLLSPL